MDLNCSKPRINASLLPSYSGRVVTLIGTAHSAAQDGMSFQVKASDGEDVRIQLMEPLQEYVDGLIEVQGKVDNRNGIECFNYVMFPADQANTFDMASYDKAVQLTNQLKEHYITTDSPQC